MTSTDRSSERPLDGLRVVVTRSKEQASALTDRLRELGATPVEVSTIAIAPPLDGGAALREAVESLAAYRRVVVASPNGARALLAELDLAPPGALPAGALPPVACVGPSTASVLEGSRLRVDIVPDRNVAEGLVDALGAPGRPGERLLLVQAEVARDVLADGLAAHGWQVDRVVAYRTVDGSPDPHALEAARHADVITFTSSSTVERYVRLAGADAVPRVVVSIGPITSSTARRLGIVVAAEADPHTIEGLVTALVAWATTDPDRAG